MTILQHPNAPFLFLFTFRYLRLLVHIVAFWLYRPAPIPRFGYVTEQDVSVIIPTIEPDNPDFTECLASILDNNPAEIKIVTVGKSRLRLTKRIIAPFRAANPDVSFKVYDTPVANKRQQVAHALTKVRTKITVLVDDHVFWPSRNFLRTAIAPFEDGRVGAVGTNKRVRRAETPFGFASFWNVMGALYLERHNFEIRTTNAIDGGVFVISGRTCLYRTAILQDPDFLKAYLNERFFFGKFGPLNADDDNYITRQVVSKGWKIKIQYTQDSMIETTLGVSGHKKFLSQCLRWVRTTWRSNSASLFTDQTVWRSQPWCVYAVYLTSFVNFALFYDAALVYTLMRSEFSSPTALKALGMWTFASKMVKITPYFMRHPKDLVYLPGYFAFAYFHSLIKLYAGLTFWVTAWGGR
ncbi:nucleotide-diphospho-sugar transferase, partial [Exophiala viscosa]